MKVVTFVRGGETTRIVISNDEAIESLLKHGVMNGYAMMVREGTGGMYRDQAEMARVYALLDFS